MIKMTIPIEPVGQLRPRATRCGRSIRMYDPPKVAKFKKQLHEYAALEMKRQKLKRFENVALEVDLQIYRQVQNSISNAERCRRLSGVHRPTVKFDLDNYIKSILDGLNGVIWNDDKNIVSIVADKHYSDKQRIEIKVCEWR